MEQKRETLRKFRKAFKYSQRTGFMQIEVSRKVEQGCARAGTQRFTRAIADRFRLQSRWKQALTPPASRMQYNFSMKTATIPPIRVEPEFRLEIEGLLEQGESLSEFVETAVRATVEARKTRAEFVKRGMAAIDQSRREGTSIPADQVMAKLRARVAAARASKAG